VNKTMVRLEKLAEFQRRDNELKMKMNELNQEISEFISKDLGVTGQATLVDIVKHALETSLESNIIQAP